MADPIPTQAIYPNGQPYTPTSTRLAASGLVPGGSNPYQPLSGSVVAPPTYVNAGGGVVDTTQDWRIRLSFQQTVADLFYNTPNSLMSPLSITNGVIFPYTPQITVSHTARYGTNTLTHSNYASYFYEGSEIGAISITGDFTVQNVEEGTYLMAAIQFFRVSTKMFYGKDVLAGTPPPMVFLNGYGSEYFPNVPCVVTNFSHTLPSDVDYMEIPAGTNAVGAPVRLPTLSQLQVTLQPVYSRNNIANNFGLVDYGAGTLRQPSGGSSGGFL